MPTRSPNSRSVIIAKFFLVSALRGKLRRFSCCSVLGPPRSSGQVSNATQGVIAMRAPLGHLIGFRFGLTFILPPWNHKTISTEIDQEIQPHHEDTKRTKFGLLI